MRFLVQEIATLTTTGFKLELWPYFFIILLYVSVLMR